MNTVKLLASIIFLFTFLCSSLTAGLQDRAFATHNVGKVGYFTTNIGQFYPYGGQFEKTLEYPINSGHIAMYRQCLMIGVPVNVISAADGRFEEFDAVGGYNAGKAEIAISDDPSTWPAFGWPVRDENNNPVILSQQDSYCIYSDSTNWRYANNNEPDALLDIRIHQSIYTWGVEGYDKFVVMKFEIENASDKTIKDMYFNFYSDLDIGGNGNAEREWADDCIGFDKDRELVYFYDSDNFSDEWNEPDPFLSGVTFLKTPNDQGITDFHWIDVTIDEVAVNSAFWDSLSYNLMRSDTSYFHEHPSLKVSDFFHLGDNPLNGTHYDDPATTRITDDEGNLIGGPMVAYIVNGPFDILPGERAEIWVGVVVGDNEQDLLDVTDVVREEFWDGFNIPVVEAPRIRATARDKQIVLSWDNQVDLNDPDLSGYIIYRSTDQTTLADWQVLDTLQAQYVGDSLFIENAYTYTDNNVYNGFNYIYNVSAYRISPAGLIEESVMLGDINNINNVPNAAFIEPTSEPAVSKSEMDKIRVVPNPFVVSARWDEERLGNFAFGEPVRNIAFTNLPSPCTIRIYTLDGDLVQTLQHEGVTGRSEWNMLTSENRPVVSGIYFYHVKSALGEKTGRFAIIR